MPSLSQPGPLGAPLPTGQYDDLLQIKVFLQAHARQNGYAISVQKTTPKDGAWICSKGGKCRDKGKSSAVYESKRRKNTATTKTDCPFRVRAALDADGKFTTVVVDPNHNHDAVVALSALPHHRLGALTDDERQKVANMNQLGHSPTAILTALRHVNPNSCLVPRDIYNKFL
jgi:FAR1 DNA-binding domain